MTEIVEQKIVSGCKNPFRTFYIAVMHYGVWLLIFLWKEQIEYQLEDYPDEMITQKQAELNEVPLYGWADRRAWCDLCNRYSSK